MKRLLLALGLWIAPLAAAATQITNPHVFTNGETLNAANLNAPIAVIYSWANGNIDNTNIGPAGIWASQISAGSTTEATFSSNFGFIFTSAATGQTPLTIVPAQGTTVNQFQIDTTSGAIAFSVDKLGDLTSAGGGTFANAVQAGLSTGLFTQLLQNGLQSYNDGAASGFAINPSGGAVSFGGAVTVAGPLTSSGTVTIPSSGLYVGSGTGTVLTGTQLTVGGNIEAQAAGGSATAVVPVYSTSGSAGTLVPYTATNTRTIQFNVPISITANPSGTVGVLLGSTGFYYFPSPYFTNAASYVCQATAEGPFVLSVLKQQSAPSTEIDVGVYSIQSSTITSVYADVTCTGY